MHHLPGENEFGRVDGPLVEERPWDQVDTMPEDVSRFPMANEVQTDSPTAVAVTEGTPALRGILHGRFAEVMRRRAKFPLGIMATTGTATPEWPVINGHSTGMFDIASNLDLDTANRMALNGFSEAADNALMPDGRKLETRLAVGAHDFPMFELTPIHNRPGGIIRIFHGSHERNAEANRVEVDQMVALGDNREFSEKEFAPYFDHSFVIEHSEIVDGQEKVTGMMRITPFSPEDGTLKTFKDISVLTHGDETLETKTPEQIQAEFIAESGIKDMTAAWDINTLALDLEMDPRDKMLIINNLLGALNEVGAAHINTGRLTHIVSENEPRMHHTLIKMGYPMRNINGYGDMHYNLDGSGEAMVCHPAYFRIAELYARIAEPDTSHLRRLHSALTDFE
jgi:hypothetical protein